MSLYFLPFFHQPVSRTRTMKTQVLRGTGKRESKNSKKYAKNVNGNIDNESYRYQDSLSLAKEQTPSLMEQKRVWKRTHIHTAIRSSTMVQRQFKGEKSYFNKCAGTIESKVHLKKEREKERNYIYISYHKQSKLKLDHRPQHTSSRRKARRTSLWSWVRQRLLRDTTKS